MNLSSLIAAVSVVTLLLVSCVDPAPPPRFRPNPPYPPEQVDPYGNPQTNVEPSTQPNAPSNPDAPATTEPTHAPRDYPIAKPTNQPGEVISPFEPDRIIDVKGFKSGVLARDPNTQKIFRVP